MRPLPIPANDDPPALAAALVSRAVALRDIVTDTRWSAGVRAAAVDELEKINDRMRAVSAEMTKIVRGHGLRPRPIEA